MPTDTRIHAHTLDNHFRIKALYLGLCVKLVEISYTDSKVCVGEKLNCFGLCRRSEKDRNILRISSCTFVFCMGTFKKKICKKPSFFHLIRMCADYDSGREQIVIKRFGLT